MGPLLALRPGFTAGKAASSFSSCSYFFLGIMRPYTTVENEMFKLLMILDLQINTEELLKRLTRKIQKPLAWKRLTLRGREVYVLIRGKAL